MSTYGLYCDTDLSGFMRNLFIFKKATLGVLCPTCTLPDGACQTTIQYTRFYGYTLFLRPLGLLP